MHRKLMASLAITLGSFRPTTSPILAAFARLKTETPMPPDLSKHIARAKTAIEKRSYDLAIEQMHQCVDVDPTNIDVHRIHLEASRRKAKEAKKSMFSGLAGGLGTN